MRSGSAIRPALFLLTAALLLLLGTRLANAVTIGPPVRLVPPADYGTRLAVGGATVVITWRRQVGSDHRIFFSRSADSGKTWSTPVPQPTPSGTDDDPASVAADGAGNWMAAWARWSDDFATATLLVSRSSDDAVSWSDAVDPGIWTAQNEPPGSPFLAPRVAAVGGAWLLVASAGIHDNINPLFQHLLVYVSRSTDGGTTWPSPLRLDTRDVPIGLATDGTDVLLTAFEPPCPHGICGKALSIWRSGDGGRTWEGPVDPHGLPLAASGQPLAGDGTGSWVTLWSSTNGILTARSSDAGENWTQGPLIAAAAAASPRLVVANGRWVAAWGGWTGSTSVLTLSHSCDAGASWAPPSRLDAPGALADMATAADGALVAAFTANDAVEIARIDVSSYCTGCDDGDACTTDAGDAELGCTHVDHGPDVARQLVGDATAACRGHHARQVLHRLRRAARLSQAADRHVRSRTRRLRHAARLMDHAALALDVVGPRLPAACLTALVAARDAGGASVACVAAHGAAP